MRIFITLLCLTSLTLTACDKEAENKPALPNNQAGQTAEQNTGPKTANDAGSVTADDATATIVNVADDEDDADDDGFVYEDVFDEGDGADDEGDADVVIVAPGVPCAEL